jgi:hypothetical protein
VDNTDEESSYVCICVPGYTGRICEKGTYSDTRIQFFRHFFEKSLNILWSNLFKK